MSNFHFPLISHAINEKTVKYILCEEIKFYGWASVYVLDPSMVACHVTLLCQHATKLGCFRYKQMVGLLVTF